MSEKNSNPDLESFRQQWRKELNYKLTHADSGPSTSKSSADGMQTPTHKVNQISDYSLPPLGAEQALVPLHDDNSHDGFEINKFKPRQESSDTASEYFPFKILTQFLNEAPKRLESKRVKEALKASPSTLSKKRYFQEKEEQAAKVLKKDVADSVESNERKTEGPKQMLDLFIADLDDINEIPFFDTTVPREVALKIFQHLDMKSLCMCSQVSRSWRSLADDELLWFEIFVKLGLGGTDTNMHVSQGSNWKGQVQHLMEKKQLLEANWKLRTGKPYQLHYVQGGVLCAVHSHGSIIVAGYTSCNVRSWDTASGDTCTFNASNTALVLEEDTEDDTLCRIENQVQHIQTSERYTAASFAHGFVDVWSPDAGTEPIHTLPFNSRHITSLALRDVATGDGGGGGQASLVAAAQGTRVQASYITELQGQVVADFDMPTKVSQVSWLGSLSNQQSANLLITSVNTVNIRKVELPLENYFTRKQDPVNMTEVHNVYWAPITAVSVRPCLSDLAVGFSVYSGASAQIKVNVYDLTSLELSASLTGHTWVISTIHLPESVPKQLITGSGDRKIRLYDQRAASFPMLTLAGHSAKVTCVEMDTWKIVSADEAGFVFVWDQRMARKLWDVHNRHSVEYCHCEERLLIIGNVPCQKFPKSDDFDKLSALRYRGTVQVYDFLANQQRQDIPDICLSGYSEPEAFNYNIGLAVPYDQVS